MTLKIKTHTYLPPFSYNIERDAIMLTRSCLVLAQLLRNTLLFVDRVTLGIFPHYFIAGTTRTRLFDAHCHTSNKNHGSRPTNTTLLNLYSHTETPSWKKTIPIQLNRKQVGRPQGYVFITFIPKNHEPQRDLLMFTFSQQSQGVGGSSWER